VDLAIIIIPWPSSSSRPSTSTIIITSPFGLYHWSIPTTHLAIPQHQQHIKLGRGINITTSNINQFGPTPVTATVCKVESHLKILGKNLA
jgi:hypothetical protein